MQCKVSFEKYEIQSWLWKVYNAKLTLKTIQYKVNFEKYTIQS